MFFSVISSKVVHIFISVCPSAFLCLCLQCLFCHLQLSFLYFHFLLKFYLFVSNYLLFGKDFCFFIDNLWSFWESLHNFLKTVEFDCRKFFLCHCKFKTLWDLRSIIWLSANPRRNEHLSMLRDNAKWLIRVMKKDSYLCSATCILF